MDALIAILSFPGIQEMLLTSLATIVSGYLVNAAIWLRRKNIADIQQQDVDKIMAAFKRAARVGLAGGRPELALMQEIIAYGQQAYPEAFARQAPTQVSLQKMAHSARVEVQSESLTRALNMADAAS